MKTELKVTKKVEESITLQLPCFNKIGDIRYSMITENEVIILDYDCYLVREKSILGGGGDMYTHSVGLAYDTEPSTHEEFQAALRAAIEKLQTYLTK